MSSTVADNTSRPFRMYGFIDNSNRSQAPRFWDWNEGRLCGQSDVLTPPKRGTSEYLVTKSYNHPGDMRHGERIHALWLNLGFPPYRNTLLLTHLKFPRKRAWKWEILDLDRYLLQNVFGRGSKVGGGGTVLHAAGKANIIKQSESGYSLNKRLL